MASARAERLRVFRRISFFESRLKFPKPSLLRSATEIADGHFEFQRDPRSIEREASLDGLSVTCTSESPLQAADVARSYKRQARVERAFRCLKTAALLVRPIRHRKLDCVCAHLLLCLLAYYVEWDPRQALVPPLFAGEGLAGWQARRDPVAISAPSSFSMLLNSRRMSSSVRRRSSLLGLLSDRVA